MGDAGFAAAEGSWNSAGASLDSGEQSVEHALSGKQGVVAGELLCHGSGVAHGPEVGHAHVDLLAALGFQDCDGLAHGVLARGHHLDQSAGDLGGNHDSVLAEEVVFESAAEHVAANDELPGFEALEGSVVPEFVLVE